MIEWQVFEPFAQWQDFDSRFCLAAIKIEHELQGLRRSNRPGGRFVELVGGLAPAEFSSRRQVRMKTPLMHRHFHSNLALPTRFELVYLP